MTEIGLYQELILDHYRRPRCFGPLPEATRRADGNNPLCGDRISVALEMEGDRLERVRFQGSGCAISTASASLMSEAVQGRTEAEVRELIRTFQEMLTGDGSAPQPSNGALGKLVAFAGVKEYPMRVKCATLAWHTLRAALDERGGTTTE